MTAPRGPLPGVARPPQRVMAGAWRGVVDRAQPLAVSVPNLTGQGYVIRGVESVAGLTAPLAVGDRVWVMCVEGQPEYLVVIGRRD